MKLGDVEEALVELAALSGHVETAVLFLKRNDVPQAIIELRAALAATHRVKLRVLAIRWMADPQRLLRGQVKWFKKN